MSPEIIAIVVSGVGIVVALGSALFAGFAWVSRRMDDRIDSVRQEIDAVRQEVTAVKHEVVEVKVAVARLEGSRQQLLLSR